MKIENKNVLISGGGSGLGAATARELFRKGANLFILDKNFQAAQAVAQEVGGTAIECDITDVNKLNEIFNHGILQNISLSVCVNCAGIVNPMKIIGHSGWMPLDHFESVVKVNLLGTFNVMRFALEKMYLNDIKDENSERGVIINISSIAAFEGQVGQVAYSASKGGVAALTLPAARELANYNIRVNCIAPGLVNTPLMSSIPDKAKETLMKYLTFPKRYGEPEEFAMLVNHIIENPYINGVIIRLDAGLRMP